MSTHFPAGAGNSRENFDTEPLSWVMSEIRDALARSKEALSDAAGKDADTQATLLRHAKTFVHQAHGALQLVDIGGVSLITQASEDLIERFAAGALELTKEHAEQIGTAFQAFVEYLDELLSGARTQPVRLFPYYRALLEMGHAARIHPADLFFPDTDVRLPPDLLLPSAPAPASFTALRQRFEIALLTMLKGGKPVAGSEPVAAMGAIIAELERTQVGVQARQFWCVMRAYAELAAAGQAGDELYVKQLFGKINLQIRVLLQGSALVSERLLRDALFFIALAQQPTPLAAKIRSAYRLDGTVPRDFEHKRYGHIDAHALSVAKDALTLAKGLWSRVASGDAKAAATFDAEMQKLVEASQKLNAPPLAKLIGELNGIARATQARLNESLSLEIATSLLFIENALDQITRLSDDFPQRADALTARLLSLVAGDAPLAPADWLDDLSRKAQERQTVTALAMEMKSSLRHVEKLLDEYFVDNSTRGALAGIDPVLHQIAGALAILEQDDASRALEHTRAEVQKFAQAGEDGDEPASRQALQDVAQNISALGFFIEMLPQHPESAKNRFSFNEETGIFRANLLENPCPPAFDITDFEDGKLIDPHEGAVLGMGFPASVQPAIPDLPVPVQAEPAAEQFVPDSVPPQTAEPVPEPVPAVPEPALVTDEAIDAELLEIFMSEAVEVLAFVKQTVPDSRDDHHNQDLLATLRRSFHTLKGSGRMVGLTAFASAAGSVEQVLNLWLSEERSGTPDLYALLDTAERELSLWVDEITRTGHSRRNPGALVSAADGVKNEGKFHYDPSQAAEPLVPVAEAVVTDLVVPEATAAEPVSPEAVIAEAALEVAPDALVEPFDLGSELQIEAELPAVAENDATVGGLLELPELLADEAPAESETVELTLPAELADELPEAFEEAIVAELPPLELDEDASADAQEPAALDVVEEQPEAMAQAEQPVVENDESETFVVDLSTEAPVEESASAALPPLSAGDDAVADVEQGYEAHAEDLPQIEPEEELGEVVVASFTQPDAKPALKLASESAEVIEFPRSVVPNLNIDDNIKHIGDLEIGVPLYNIYLAETDEIVRLLAQDFSEWRHEPHRHVSTHAIHAAHSLAGSSATVGFQALQKIAHALEMVLQTMGRRHVPLSHAEFDTLDMCVERIKRMLQAFALGELPAEEPQLVQLLAQMQDDIVARAAVKHDSDFDLAIEPLLAEGIDPDTAAELLAPGATDLPAADFASLDPETALQELVDDEPQPKYAPVVKQAAAGSELAFDSSLDVPVSGGMTIETAAAQLDASDTAAQGEDAGQPEAVLDADELQVPALAELEAVELQQAVGDVPAVQATEAGYGADALLDPTLAVNDELDPDLLPVFLEEGRDLLPQIGQGLEAWQQSPSNTGLAQSVLRLLHTVKGSARMAGAMRLGQHTHEMESRIENMLLAGSQSSMSFDDLTARHDRSMQLFEQLQNPQAVQKDAPSAAVPALSAAAPATLEAAVPASAPQASGMPAAPATSVPMLRVRADILDRLVNQAGEVSIARSKLETEVETLRQSLSELTDNMHRLRSQLREVEMQAESQITSRMTHANDREFDPLEFDRFTRLQELTRMMAESVDDVASVQDNLVRTVDGATLDLAAQARLTRELQQDLMRVRMVPFASISERLYRVTRQASKEIEKRVNLDIRGTSVTIDRGVLEKMAGPFEHLLRNSIAHGIESRAERLAAGKNEAGELLVEIRQEGNEVVIQFRDDGRGLDLNRIRDKAIASGLLEAERDVNESEVADFIFQPGFSTAKEVTTLAGRGIGMDVVRSEAAALGGRVDVVSEPGKGARFTIHLPLTLAVTQVVLLSTGGMTYAVPSNLVEQVQQLKSNSLALAYNEGAVFWQGQRIPLHYLSAMLGDSQATPVVQQYSPVLIMNSGNERIAIHVDFVLGNREVVVKNIGPQLARMVGIAGATVLGSGDIVLILNPVALAQRASHEQQFLPRTPLLAQPAPAEPGETQQTKALGAVAEAAKGEQDAAGGPEQLAAAPVQGLRKKHIVMVVDDSLTVRRVSQRFLVREGYQVVLAKDGVDALEQLQAIKPDVMLVDIEMPRMDGFDLTRNVRGDERIAQVPIIMITSRTADKHRNYALELGVNRYFGKPFQEEQLLQAIKSLIQQNEEVPV